MDGEPGLELLLAHADDHRPVLDRFDDAACHREGEGVEKTAKREHLADDSASLEDLASQRWGLIVPQGERGEELLRRVQPLIDKRREDQGGHAIKIYRVPDRMTMLEAARWRKTEYDTGEGLQTDLPRYQLILGDLHEVPLALQLTQGMQGCVGRLAFDRDRDYSAYVEKLLSWERRPSAAARGRSLFHTAHDSSRAIDTGYRELVEPGVVKARTWSKDRDDSKYPAASVDELDPYTTDPDDLLAVVRDVPPSVLFTMSHGVGSPRRGWRSDDEQRALQGAMSFGLACMLTGRDIANTPFLPGGFWFMFACFGAGTPGHGESKYHHWLTGLTEHGEYNGNPKSVLAHLPGANSRPFIAALPKAVLANPSGPLSFVGHVDLAWTYAFQQLDSPNVRSRPAQFLRMLREPLRGHRAGVAMRQIPLALGAVETELTSHFDDDERHRRAGRRPRPDPRRGHLWMLRQDLLGFVMLGDPAARLPLTRPDPKATPDRDAVAPGHVVGSDQGPNLALSGRVDVDAIELAIAKIIAEIAREEDLAGDLGVTRRTLTKLRMIYAKAGRRAIEDAVG